MCTPIWEPSDGGSPFSGFMSLVQNGGLATQDTRACVLSARCKVVSMNDCISCLVFCVLQFAGSKDNFAAQIEKDTEEKLKQLSVDVDTHKEEVLKRLMDLVFDIKLDIHQNLRLKEELDKR